jgi:NAD+ kinase
MACALSWGRGRHDAAVKRVGFILKPDNADAAELVAELVPWLLGSGHQPVVVDEDRVAPDGAVIVPEAQLGDECDLAVLLGGDGTMLRGSALVADAGVPVLGINLGWMGFLTPFDPSEARGAITAAIAGELTTSERMRLQVTYRHGAGDPVTRTALNDAVIHQGAMARLIEVEASLDGQLIAQYRADGVIVATPTGSTAYNLAAGGPIIVPGQRAMSLTPICAHSLTMRPLVISHQSTIALRLDGESRGVVLTVDGQWARSMLPGDMVEIAPSPRPLVVFDSDKPYFDILREKLHWGARAIR